MCILNCIGKRHIKLCHTNSLRQQPARWTYRKFTKAHLRFGVEGTNLASNSFQKSIWLYSNLRSDELLMTENSTGCCRKQTYLFSSFLKCSSEHLKRKFNFSYTVTFNMLTSFNIYFEILRQFLATSILISEFSHV